MKKNDKKTIHQKQKEAIIFSLFVNLTNDQAIVLKNYCESFATYKDLEAQKNKLEKNEAIQASFNDATQDNKNLEQELIKMKAKYNNLGLKKSDMKQFSKYLKNFNTNLIKLGAFIRKSKNRGEILKGQKTK